MPLGQIEPKCGLRVRTFIALLLSGLNIFAMASFVQEINFTTPLWEVDETKRLWGTLMVGGVYL